MRASGQFGLTPLTDNRKPSADLEPQPHSRSRKPSAPPRDGPLTPNNREISAPSPLTGVVIGDGRVTPKVIWFSVGIV
jgi:hypothetical protein